MSLYLSEENRKLREDLLLLLEQARRNEEIMRRHQEFDLKFISAGSFRELIDSIFKTLKESSELDVVTLSLLDPGYDIRRILIDLNIKLSEFPNLLFLQEEDELNAVHEHLQKAVLGRYDQERHGTMFPEPIELPASVALVPLVRNGKLIGSLSLGSFHASRFAPHMATDFLRHLGCIVAICIENVINNERLKHIGLTDPLTGVNNRRYVERRLHEEIGRVSRQGYALSCLYIDIDHFKKINDTIGHQGGDEVLCEVATRIKAELRLSDALGRLGGEEFLALLIDAESSDAMIVAERIRASIAEQTFATTENENLHVTVSIGVSTLIAPDRNASIEKMALDLIAKGDKALYQAKNSGRNRVVLDEQFPVAAN
jgi:two-component system cell cycle response regulator